MPLVLGTALLFSTSAYADHNYIVCEGTAPDENRCLKEFVADDYLTGTGILNGLDYGGFVATVIVNGTLAEVIICVARPQGHHCDDLQHLWARPGDSVRFEVRVEGEGFWRVRLSYPSHGSDT